MEIRVRHIKPSDAYAQNVWAEGLTALNSAYNILMYTPEAGRLGVFYF